MSACAEIDQKNLQCRKLRGCCSAKLPRRWLTLTAIEREQVGREKPELVVTEGTHW